MIIHLKLKVGGNPDKKYDFLCAVRQLDTDFPYAWPPASVNAREHGFICKKCGGKRYNGPKLAACDIKRLGKQMGVKVKIMHYGPADKCQGENGVLVYTPMENKPVVLERKPIRQLGPVPDFIPVTNEAALHGVV